MGFAHSTRAPHLVTASPLDRSTVKERKKEKWACPARSESVTAVPGPNDRPPPVPQITRGIRSLPSGSNHATIPPLRLPTHTHNFRAIP